MNMIKPIAAIAVAAGLVLGGATAVNAATTSTVAQTATVVKAAKAVPTTLTLVKVASKLQADGSYIVTVKVNDVPGTTVDVWAGGGGGVGRYARGTTNANGVLKLKFTVSASVYTTGVMAIYDSAGRSLIQTRSTVYGPLWASPATYVANSPK